MTDIPDDVMQAAKKIAYSQECGIPIGTEDGAKIIARAIMAERERKAAAPSVAVKALEWHDRHDIPLRANDLLAESVVGQYAIRPSSTGKRFRLWMPGMDYNSAGVHFTVESAKADAQKHYEARIRAALSAQVQDVRTDDDEEIYEIGVREGYERAVQEIDIKTGGDGEYRYCTDHDPERHTPGPAEMIQRIVDRFETLNLIGEAEKRGDFWDVPGPAQVQDVAVPEGWQLVPKEPTHAMIKAMSESKAKDDEGDFPCLFELIDFSGENKTHTALKSAYKDMLAAAPAAKQEA